MTNMSKAFEIWMFQMSKANDPRFVGYQTARAYAIQPDHPPPPTPMNFQPLNEPTEPNYQQHPWQELGPCIDLDERGHIHTSYRDVLSDQE